MADQKKSFPDLVVDTVYEGGSSGTFADDPIPRLLGVGNQGEVRYSGSAPDALNCLVLYASGEDSYRFDPETGTLRFTYHDSASSGKTRPATKRLGGSILRSVFAALHEPERSRYEVPPILAFLKCSTPESARSVRFIGLCAPGTPHRDPEKSLWVKAFRNSEGAITDNFEAYFTVLDVPKVSGRWTAALARGEGRLDLEPEAFRKWKESGAYEPIKIPNVRKYWGEERQFWWELSA